MRKRIKISVLVAIVIIILSLILQCYFVNNMYKAEQDNIKVRASLSLTDVLSAHIKRMRGERRYKPGPDDDIESVSVAGASSFAHKKIEVHINHPEKRIITREYETTEEWLEFSKDVYHNYHFSGIDMNRLDSAYKEALEKHSISLPLVLVKIDSTDSVLEQIPAGVDYNKYRLIVDTIPLGIDGKDFLVARFDNSYSRVFQQMKILFISSFCIVLLLIFITIYLLNMIFYQKKISEVREGLVESMIHDLKNPVSYLNRVFSRIKTDENQQKYLETAKIKSERMSQIIEKLLVTSSMDIDLSITPQLTNVSEFVNSIIEQYKEDNDRLCISFPGDAEVIAKIDKCHFGNALSNLIDNAIKYSGENVDISVTCKKENENISISVMDCGIGIPKEFQKYLFDKHFRVPEHKSLPCTGFGLGLCYVQIVAKAHGGDVTVKSEYKKGSEFIITIPLQK
jgi:Signal transduction histidine kinase